VVHAYLVLPHAVPIIAVVTATAAFAFVARGGWPGGPDIGMLLLAMFGGQLAVGAVNELVDVELDRASKPHKPIPAGLVSERGARVMVWSGLALMVIGSLRFSIVAFALCALGTGLGIAYSLWFKRTAWSWIPYILAIPLIPIWVWTALEDVPLALLALYPIAVPALIAIQIAQSIPDVAADRGVGVRTLAALAGEERARILCWGLALLSVVLATLFAPRVVSEAAPVWIASVASMVLIGVNVVLWRRDRDLGRMSCFPCIAVAVAVIGVGWTVGMVG
jgi:4-hydroxybenzoate polyprenyltransferase